MQVLLYFTAKISPISPNFEICNVLALKAAWIASLTKATTEEVVFALSKIKGITGKDIISLKPGNGISLAVFENGSLQVKSVVPQRGALKKEELNHE